MISIENASCRTGYAAPECKMLHILSRRTVCGEFSDWGENGGAGTVTEGNQYEL